MSSPQEVRHLLVIEDQKSRRIVPLVDNTYNIGRDPNSSILLYDRQVSRHHATLLRVTDYQNNHHTYRIIDGNLQGKRSTNGILINDNYCLSHELKHGDFIRFGTKSQARYHIIANDSEIERLTTGDNEGTLFEPSDEVKLAREAILSSGKPLPLSSEKQTYTRELLDAGSEEDEVTPKTAFVFDKAVEKHNEAALAHLSSLAECSPHPIIEVDEQGNLAYINPAANIKFSQLNKEHPILQGINRDFQYQERTSYVREIQIENEFFEQHIYYLNDNKLIRSYISDISKSKKLEQQLAVNKERYQLLAKASSEGFAVIDNQSKEILEANTAYCQLLGYDLAEILELNLYQIIALDRDILNEELAQIHPNQPFTIEELFHRCKDGSFVSAVAQVSRTLYQEKEVLCWSIRDIGELKKTEEQLRYQSLHDSLTALPNRLFFEQQLDKAIEHAEKHEHLLAVLFLDIDSFAHINNTLGHPVGDRLLQELGKRMDNCVGAGQIVARWGSDEYTLLLPQIKNLEEPIQLSQRIFAALQQPFNIDNHRINLRVSVGIAIYPQDGVNKETLLKNADTALHQTKVEGRNHYQLYTPNLSKEALVLLNLENLIHQALEKRQFALYYQPQLNLSTGKISGIEALLRWEHPELGIILPEKFIPLAQKTDVMIPLCQWILKTACKQNLSWQKDGIPSISIGVNLSEREFKQAKLIELIAHTLNNTGLDPQWLEIEITENTLRKQIHLVPKLFQNLQQLGVHLALDDFGTGYSSIGYLQRFDFHTIKLDQRLIQQLRGTPQETAIISSIMTLGRGFNQRVIAEGVETEQQVNLLKTLQCQEIQGYWVSHPLNVKEATEFLRNRV